MRLDGAPIPRDRTGSDPSLAARILSTEATSGWCDGQLREERFDAAAEFVADRADGGEVEARPFGARTVA